MEPTTIWSPTSGNGEYISTGVLDLVDTTGLFIVDTAGNEIVDTGISFYPIPETIWIEDNSQ